jgi:hypothetical protein
MRCDEFNLRFDELEPGARLSWGLRRHLTSCSRCAESARRVEASIAAWRREEGFRDRGGAERDGGAEASVNRVMAAVRMTSRPRREISLGQWAVSGMVLAFSGVLIPSFFFAGLGSAAEDSLLFPLALVLGVLLAIFGFLFIGSHFDELRERLEDFQSGRGGSARSA